MKLVFRCKRFIPVILFFMLILSACEAGSTSGTSFQNPVIPQLTTTTGWVVDTTGQLTAENERVLESIAEEMEALGFQVGIAIFENCACDTIQFATEFGNVNGIGSAEMDNGLAIVLFVGKEGGDGHAPAISVATGEGLGGLLTDGRVGRILDATYVPLRSQGNWQQGTVDLLVGFRDFLNGSRDIDSFKAPPEDYSGMIFLIIVGVIAFIIFLCIDGVFFKFAITIAIAEGLAESSSYSGSSSSGGSSSIGGGGSFGGGGASR